MIPSTHESPRSPLVLLATPGAAIACDMTQARDTPEERVAEYGRLFAHALIGRERSGTAVEFRFAAKPGVADWVSDLAQRESACCPFCTHQVQFDSERVTWRTSSDAGPEVQATLDEFYALPESIGSGLDGLLERLARRGVDICCPEPKRFRLEGQANPSGFLSKLKSACGC